MFTWEIEETPDSLLDIKSSLELKIGSRVDVIDSHTRKTAAAMTAVPCILEAVFDNMALFRTDCHRAVWGENRLCISYDSLYCGDAFLKWR